MQTQEMCSLRELGGGKKGITEDALERVAFVVFPLQVALPVGVVDLYDDWGVALRCCTRSPRYLMA